MPIKVLISGKSGKMGKALCESIAKDEKFLLVEKDPDIYIDFSAPTATLKLLQEINKPIVIGTTGFTGAEIEQIKVYSQKQPVFFSANMSVGMNLFFDLLKKVPTNTLNAQVIINEEHHQHKKDSPSGTAKKLLSILNHDKTDVRVLRAGEIFGNHSVRFILDGEELEISHKAFNRSIFAKGALRAAEFLFNQRAKTGLYENF